MIRWRAGVGLLLQPADTVSPHPLNDNNGDVEELANSIRVLGCYRPIYYSTRSGHIVAGHTLYGALVGELGATQVPLLGDDYTEEEELRIVTADNALASRAWVDPALKLDILQILAKTERGLTGTGSSYETIAQLEADRKRPYIPGTYEEEDPGTMTTCPSCKHTFPVRLVP
jgi:ParB-like chromosome segregation protein Spo0J